MNIGLWSNNLNFPAEESCKKKIVKCKYAWATILMQTFCNICSDFHIEKTEHRSLLSFLWWENGDISEERQDYHMNVHVFGVTSSPSFINYTL